MTTRGILNILQNEGNKDDLIAFMFDRNLPKINARPTIFDDTISKST
ncbi:hypothetical protein [Phormidium nigroviride]